MVRIVRIPWRPILFGLLLSVLLSTCGALFSAGGHNFALMMVFFPWAMLLSHVFTPFAWWLPFVALVALQFPLYAVVPGLIGGGRLVHWGTVCVVVVLHLLGIVWCFLIDPTESWRILFRW